MELTISQMARKLGITQKAVRNRLTRKGIKPHRLIQDVNSQGLVFSRGMYPQETINRIK
jgi:hypothetical protein